HLPKRGGINPIEMASNQLRERRLRTARDISLEQFPVTHGVHRHLMLNARQLGKGTEKRSGRMTEFFISLFPSFALCGNPQTDRCTEANKENEEDAAGQIPGTSVAAPVGIWVAPILFLQNPANLLVRRFLSCTQWTMKSEKLQPWFH